MAVQGQIECPLCLRDDISKVQTYQSKSQIFSGAWIVECMACGLHFAWPAPAEKSLEEYNSQYYDSAHGGMAEDAISTAFFKGMAGIRAQYVENYICHKEIQVQHVLEIGPGSGFFAREWIGRNPNVRYSAIETDVARHASLRELGITLLPVDQNGQEQKYDLVVMSHVLEHFPRPRHFIEKYTNSLMPGGALFIEVPCLDHKHKTIHEPHLVFFDKKSMGALLKESGYSDVCLSYHGSTLEQLEKPSLLKQRWESIRTRLIRMGVIRPFAGQQDGLGHEESQIVRAVVKPYRAHVESVAPSWWLRAMAVKNHNDY